jgi:hypothetical protein
MSFKNTIVVVIAIVSPIYLAINWLTEKKDNIEMAAQKEILPEDQSHFLKIIRDFAKENERLTNTIAQANLLKSRDQALCKFKLQKNGEIRVHDWKAKIYHLSGDSSLVDIFVKIDKDIILRGVSNNPEVADMAAKMKVGDNALISGTLFDEFKIQKKSCFSDTSAGISENFFGKRSDNTYSIKDRFNSPVFSVRVEKLSFEK